jgi:proteasome lid subunit RPN8/RPN11
VTQPPGAATNDTVRITRAILAGLVEDARHLAPIECCGLLAGRNGIISVRLTAANALRSTTAYEIAPQELCSLFRRMRSEGLDHLGIYHSHPRGDNAPSPSDIEQACYPETPYLIVSPSETAVRPVRAFRISEGQVRELALKAV